MFLWLTQMFSKRKYLNTDVKKDLPKFFYQNIDGGWGLHAEGESSMLSSALNYTALRLLGESVDDGPDMSMPKARKWIHDHGGATMIPILGKVWLSVTILRFIPLIPPKSLFQQVIHKLV